MTRTDSPQLEERLARIRLLVFDVDGVLTDGGLYYGSEGEQLKRFDVKDGLGIVLARLEGIPSALITARNSEIVAIRGRELGFVDIQQGRKDKAAALRTLTEARGLQLDEVAFMGDDLLDLEPLRLAGLAACPSDAATEVRQACHFVSSAPGGKGAARELVERVLRASGRWKSTLQRLRNLS